MVTKIISATLLGRYLSDIRAYRDMSEDMLKVVGFESVDLAIKGVYALAAGKHDVSFDDAKSQIDALADRSGPKGTREADKGTRDLLVVETQTATRVGNLAAQVHQGAVVLTDAQKIEAFDQLGEDWSVLGTHMQSSFGGRGALTFLWSPPNTDATPNPLNMIAVHVGGWGVSDKGNLRHEYAPRKSILPNQISIIHDTGVPHEFIPMYSPKQLPVETRSGYRDDSFQPDIYTPTIATVETEPDASKTKPEKSKSKSKSK